MLCQIDPTSRAAPGAAVGESTTEGCGPAHIPLPGSLFQAGFEHFGNDLARDFALLPQQPGKPVCRGPELADQAAGRRASSTISVDLSRGVG